MRPLVSLTEAKNQIRIDGTADDAWLTAAIAGVTSAIVSWLKSEARCYQTEIDDFGERVVSTDAAGNPVVDPVVKLAALNELAAQYRDREGSIATRAPDSWGHGYVLGVGATALLNGLRKPTVG